jgi:hypothetical protein
MTASPTTRPERHPMSRWCDHFAITPDEMAVVLDAADEGDAALDEWFEDVREKHKGPWHVEQDKAWELIHRCLTEDHLPNGELDPESGDPPLSFCILGGERLHEDWARSFWLVRPDEVAELASTMHELDEGWLRKRFFGLPDWQFVNLQEDLFLSWVWDYFRDLCSFYLHAAEHQRAVVCSISH